MRRTLLPLLLAAATLLLGGVVLADQHHHGAGDGHGKTHADAGKQSEYTLKEVMQHLAAAQAEIQIGLLTNNRLMIQRGAHRIGNHPMPKGGIKPYIKKNIAALKPTIKKMDGLVHDSAVEIAKTAATAKMVDLQVLNNRMVTGCISCHNVFRD